MTLPPDKVVEFFKNFETRYETSVAGMMSHISFDHNSEAFLWTKRKAEEMAFVMLLEIKQNGGKVSIAKVTFYILASYAIGVELEKFCQHIPESENNA